MKIHLLYDWLTEDGQEFPKGHFLEVDDLVGQELIEEGTAEAKTPEDLAIEEEDRARDMRRREQKKRRDEARGQVTKIHERAKDDPSAGFQSMGEFAHDVALACRQTANVSDKLDRWHAHCKQTVVEYDDSQGGYLVPPEYSNRLLRTSLETAVVRPRATFIPMQTNRIAINAVVDEDHSSSLFGGINIQRPGEMTAKDPDKPTFRQIVLTLHKLTGLVRVSDEIIEDSPISMEPLLTDLFGAAIAWQEDEDFINGTGINQALGIINAGCTVTQAIEAGQVAGTIVYENIVNMWSRMHPRCHANAIWMCNPSCIPELYTMALAVGTGGSAVFVPAGGASATPYASLMGRPLVVSEKCQALGTAGDLILADWSQYLIGGKAGSGAPKVTSSIHLYFAYDAVAFRFVLRYDGQPWWRVALTPAFGGAGATLSPFVILDDR